MRRGGLPALVAGACALILLVAGASPVPAQQTRVLLIVGLGGDPAYTETFHEWAVELRDAALAAGALERNIAYFGEDPSRDPDIMAGRSTRENLETAVAEIAEQTTPEDRVLLVFIGHGTASEGDASINLPGPDLTGAELAELLSALSDRTVAVVNTAPSSGPWIEHIAGPGRIVVTATRTDRERNETRFGGFFTEAFASEGADLDKDGRVSLLEAFRYARREVERDYESENLLLTEHATLDDDGDGDGSDTFDDVSAGDGRLAARFWLGATAGDRASVAASTALPDSVTDPELRRLLVRQDSLEREVVTLRARRDSLPPDAYETALEALLVELAITSRAIREHGGDPS